MNGFSVKTPEDWNLDYRTGGCMRNTQLDCNVNKSTKELTDQFFPISSVSRLPSNAHAMEAIANTNECTEVCQSNCSCTAFSYSKGVCSIWQGELLNVKQQNGTTNTDGEIIYLRLAAQEIHS